MIVARRHNGALIEITAKKHSADLVKSSELIGRKAISQFNARMVEIVLYFGV